MMTPEIPKPQKNEKTDPTSTLGIPRSTHLPLEDQPSPQMQNETERQHNKAQADFMKPERADADSNRKSGAL